VFYTQGPEGVAWTAPETVARTALDAALGYAGKPVVIYHRVYKGGFALFSTSGQ